MRYCKIIILIILLYTTTLIAHELYKPYECEYFKIGDKVVYSFHWLYFEKNDFVGIVTKIEPKPTNEHIHLITIQRVRGNGTSGTYSEQFLKNIR